jgi:hypothetical protein
VPPSRFAPTLRPRHGSPPSAQETSPAATTNFDGSLGGHPAFANDHRPLPRSSCEIEGRPSRSSAAARTELGGQQTIHALGQASAKWWSALVFRRQQLLEAIE